LAELRSLVDFTNAKMELISENSAIRGGKTCGLGGRWVPLSEYGSYAERSGATLLLGVGAVAAAGKAIGQSISSASSSSSGYSGSSSSSGSPGQCYQLEKVKAEKGEAERWKIRCGDGAAATIYRDFGKDKFSFNWVGAKREGMLDAMNGYSTPDHAARVACGCR
jgi:hypothetical protein